MILLQKLMIAGGAIIAFSVVFGFVAFEQILKFAVRDQTALRKRNEIRSIYLKLPFPLEFCVYFFNVSNPIEVQTGATPILKQVGPYCYDEYVEKLDVVDNDGDDSLTYSPYAVFKFNQNKSGTLSDEDDVTIIHPLVIGMVTQVKDSAPLLPIVNKAIGLLFPDLKSIYLTAKVKDILFDGIGINCKVTDFPAKAVCNQLKSITGIQITENEVYRFSILGPRNATLGKRVKVSRGISQSRNLGKILELDGKREVNFWKTQECNALKGSDGWIFPPLLTPEEGMWSFSADLCRSIGAVFIEDTEVKGLNVRYYEVDLGDMQLNEKDKCYCSTPKTCLKKGVFDLTKCLGVPIYATLPHFLRTDEIYSSQVVGLNPIPEDHIINVYVEPLTSTPIEAHKRMQFNFPIAPNSKIDLMKNIPEALHPIFWIEENVSLDGPLLKKVTIIFSIIEAMKIMRWIGIFLGIAIIAYGFFDYFKETKTVKITPVHQKGSSSIDANKIDPSSFNRNEKEIGNLRTILNGHEFDRYEPGKRMSWDLEK